MPLALNIPEILEKISKYLPFKDLKTWRMVNWTWNKTASRALRGRCKMMKFAFLDKNDQSFRFWKITKTFQNCLQGTKKRSEFPVSKLFLLINSYAPLNVAEFLTIVSPFVEELWIKVTLKMNRLPEPDCSYIKLIDYPVLKKVRIILFDGLPSYSEYSLNRELEDNRGRIHFFTNLFRSASQLHSFSVEIDLTRQDENVKAIGKCHSIILDSFELSNKFCMIQHLETDMPYDNANAVGLARIKLTSLKLCVEYKFEDKNTLLNLLKSQSETLRILEITDDSVVRQTRAPTPILVEDCLLEFPQMKKLECLSLKCSARHCRHSEVTVLGYRNISYQNWFPVLTKIEFINARSAMSAFIEFATDSSDTVTELILKGDNKKFDKNNPKFVKAHLVFPKLKKIGLSGDKFLCDYVYTTNMSHLEELTLIAYSSSNRNRSCFIRCITGYHEAWYDCCDGGITAFDLKGYNSDSESDTELDCIPGWNRKSLSCLKNLKTLTLVTHSYILSGACFQEIMECPEMQRLIIKMPKNNVEETIQCINPEKLSNMRSKFSVCFCQAEEDIF